MSDRNKIATKTIDVEAQTVRFDFTNGDFVECAASDLPQDIKVLAMLHGVSQKGGDVYSGEKDVTEAVAKCREAIERMQRGEWVARRAPGEASASLTVEAIAVLQSKDVAAVQEIWKGLDEATQKAIRKDPKVQAKMAEIKAARLAAKAETAEDDGSDALAAFAA